MIGDFEGIGTYWLDAAGELWQLTAYCAQPTVTFTRVRQVNAPQAATKTVALDSYTVTEMQRLYTLKELHEYDQG